LRLKARSTLWVTQWSCLDQQFVQIDILQRPLQPESVSQERAFPAWAGAGLTMGFECLALLTITGRGEATLGIPPEFIDNSLLWSPLTLHGIGSVVGEHGVQLSSGQCLRLSIARIF